MKNKNFEVYFDFGSSKIRVGAVNKNDTSKNFFYESEFFTDYKNLESEIEKIIFNLEKKSNEYLNSINLMVDTSEMLPINLSVSKNF